MQNPFSIRSNSFVPAIIPPVEYQGESYWFLFRGDQIFVKRDSSSFQIPFAKECRELGVLPVRVEYLGVLNGSLCFSGELDSEAEIPAGFELQGIRGLYGVVDDLFFGLTGLAFQIVDWDRNNQFCGRCGTPMDPSETERCKICPRCRLMVYPRLSPAVIMRVQKGDQILMARSPRFLTKIYSVLAGFVEPGESLEEAVAREVFEEVGIKIREIKYFGSQPWPFPNSLMIAFTAQYDSGEIQIDPNEIEDAGWYQAPDLPPLPGKISIAYRLIEDYINHQSI